MRLTTATTASISPRAGTPRILQVSSASGDGRISMCIRHWARNDRPRRPLRRSACASRNALPRGRRRCGNWLITDPSAARLCLVSPGLALYSRFLNDSGHGEHVAVWPFETSFGTTFEKAVVFAEIYPSLFTLTSRGRGEGPGAGPNRRQGFRRFDADGRLATLLDRPPMLSDEEVATSIARRGGCSGSGIGKLATELAA